MGGKVEVEYFAGDVDIDCISLEDGDQFVIIASDGLWDVMTSEEAVKFVNNIMSSHVGALREGGDADDAPSDRPGNRRGRAQGCG